LETGVFPEEFDECSTPRGVVFAGRRSGLRKVGQRLICQGVSLLGYRRVRHGDVRPVVVGADGFALADSKEQIPPQVLNLFPAAVVAEFRVQAVPGY
jgi:hypothetical protein